MNIDHLKSEGDINLSAARCAVTTRIMLVFCPLTDQRRPDLPGPVPVDLSCPFWGHWTGRYLSCSLLPGASLGVVWGSTLHQGDDSRTATLAQGRKVQCAVV